MKKIIFLAVLAVLLVSVVSVFAHPAVALADGEDNLKKAGQQALAEAEETLRLYLEEIEAYYVQGAAADRVITKDEMIALRDSVSDFVRVKKVLDGQLTDYGLKTTTVLDERYEKALFVYFVSNALFKEDIHGEVRRFFASHDRQ